jgi:8-oxo-dGTP pyrophosphatase MutT (NUDIX family)
MGFAAGCLVIHGWHVLLGLRGSRESEPLTWGPFGGGAEPGEDALACMLREVREEAGIALDPACCALLSSQAMPDGFSFHTFVAFPARCPHPILGSESRAFGWFPLGRTPRDLWGALPEPLHSGVRDLVGRASVAQALIDMRGTLPPAPGRVHG